MSSNTVDISGLDKAELLAAFYNAAAIPQGMGLLHYVPGPITRDEALMLFERGDDSYAMFGQRFGKPEWYFDYLLGRCLKVDLTGDLLYVDGWDRDYGRGSAERLVGIVREASSIPDPRAAASPDLREALTAALAPEEAAHAA